MASPFRSMVTEFVACRGPARHSWEYDHNAPEGPQRIPGIRVTFMCTRCGTTKTEVWSKATGEKVIPARYRHPQGYKVPAEELDALENVSNELRKEYIRRLNLTSTGRRGR